MEDETIYKVKEFSVDNKNIIIVKCNKPIRFDELKHALEYFRDKLHKDVVMIPDYIDINLSNNQYIGKVIRLDESTVMINDIIKVKENDTIKYELTLSVVDNSKCELMYWEPDWLEHREFEVNDIITVVVDEVTDDNIRNSLMKYINN